MDTARYHIIVSEDALSMLDRRVEFLARVSPSAARRTAEQIMNGIEALAQLPERHQFYDNPFVPSKRCRQMLSKSGISFCMKCREIRCM
ncbi:MAG: hypothetical protein LBT12_01290 [Oscillospiraceae bacterium]|jgi:plasmid stabilization system protein ParE|nr:hypothetical protein [Oscillospiraceae bacterium]